jgi:hypothetical protein
MLLVSASWAWPAPPRVMPLGLYSTGPVTTVGCLSADMRVAGVAAKYRPAQNGATDPERQTSRHTGL